MGAGYTEEGRGVFWLYVHCDGAPEGAISEAIARSGAHVKMFNIDCPGQVVIAGETEAVRATASALLPPGFRIVRLNVNAAFHSKLGV